MNKSYPIWNEVEDNNAKSNGVVKNEKINVKVQGKDTDTFHFLTTEIKTFTSMYGEKFYLFYIDGELVKEASYNPIQQKFEMRSKIHPRNFIQKDMLLKYHTPSITEEVTRHSKN